MAREYLAIDEWERWVPGVDNEREIAQSDPSKALSMELRFMSLKERKEVQRIGSSALRGVLEDAEYNEHMVKIFRRHVRNVQGYVYNGKPITTGEELFLASEEDLVSAIVQALLNRSYLEAGLSKKLNMRSDTFGSQRKSRESGVAQDVIQLCQEIIPEVSEKTETCGSLMP